jgi:hypothetical protein
VRKLFEVPSYIKETSRGKITAVIKERYVDDMEGLQ